MKIEIITLFPELFAPFLEWSMIKKAREIKALDLIIHNLRNWAIDKRGTVDDHPYGGGPGMILRIEPVFNALKDLKKENSTIVLLSPKGETFNQKKAQELSEKKHLILISGHYEGVDQRIRQHLIDQDVSIGDYVLSGGELPAMVVTDALSRLLPGVLKKESASEIESFSETLKEMKKSKEKSLLEFPQYTRPSEFKNWKVPKVLLSGNHQEIVDWRIKRIKKKKKAQL